MHDRQVHVRNDRRVDNYVAFHRLAKAVYPAARAGTVDGSDAYDLAASALKLNPRVAEATELASLSLEGAGASRPRMSELVLGLLAAAGFDPGFSEEPAWLGRLEDAMRRVNRDLAASGLAECRLRVRADEPGLTGNAYAETGDGHAGSGVGVYPAAGAEAVSALVAVAEDAQDAVMHSLWAAWPLCPVHERGVHALRCAKRGGARRGRRLVVRGAGRSCRGGNR